jgi:hypothetical protein
MTTQEQVIAHVQKTGGETPCAGVEVSFDATPPLWRHPALKISRVEATARVMSALHQCSPLIYDVTCGKQGVRVEMCWPLDMGGAEIEAIRVRAYEAAKKALTRSP